MAACMVPMAIVGVWLLVAGAPVYAHYRDALGATGALHDQRAAGLIMLLAGVPAFARRAARAAWRGWSRRRACGPGRSSPTSSSPEPAAVRLCPPARQSARPPGSPPCVRPEPPASAPPRSPPRPPELPRAPRRPGPRPATSPPAVSKPRAQAVIDRAQPRLEPSGRAESASQPDPRAVCDPVLTRPPAAAARPPPIGLTADRATTARAASRRSAGRPSAPSPPATCAQLRHPR